MKTSCRAARCNPNAILAVALVAASAAASGCSSFEEKWETAAASLESRADREPGVPVATGPEGRWRGQWVSESSGHSGELRAVIAASDDPPGWIAHYRAKWGPFFSFEYDLPFEIEGDVESSGVLHFRSEADLGWLWGVYKQEGEITGDRMRSSYKSAHDEGHFELERVRDDE